MLSRAFTQTDIGRVLARLRPASRTGDLAVPPTSSRAVSKTARRSSEKDNNRRPDPRQIVKIKRFVERKPRLLFLTGRDIQDKAAAKQYGRIEDVEVNHLEVMRYIGGFIWPDDWRSRFETLGSFAATMSGRYFQSLAPNYISKLTDTLADSKVLLEGDSEDWAEILRTVLLFGCCRLLALGSREMRNILYSHVIKKANTRMASEMFQVLQDTDLDFLLRNRPGELTSHVIGSSRALGALLSNLNHRAVPMYMDITSLTGKFRKIKRNDLSTLAKTTLAIYFLFSCVYGDVRVRERLVMNKADSGLRGSMLESLQNGECVRALHTGRREIFKFARRYDSYETSKTQVSHSLATMNVGQQLILRTSITLAMLRTANRIFKGECKSGEMPMVMHMFDGLVHPLNFVGTMYREFKANYQEIVQGIKLLKIRSVRDAPNAKPLVINRGSIQFRNTSFRYPGTDMAADQDDVLRNINLSIAGKSTVAIVGPSGSGKSTLLRLILRLYSPQSGTVGICGQDVSQVTLKSLRKAIALVPQEVFLFNTSLRENLLYGSETVPETGDTTISEERLMEVIRLCGLEELVRKISLDGIVGERGLALSGGERRRVGVARAMLRDAPIVLLDEPTSGLDAKNQNLVMQAINRLANDRTVVMVAHKLSTVANADEIVYLESGMIKERGTHEQLISRPAGKYNAMWKLQESGMDTTDGSTAVPDDTTETSSSCSSSGPCCHD